MRQVTAHTTAHYCVEESLLPEELDYGGHAGGVSERDGVEHGSLQGTTPVTTAHEESIVLPGQLLHRNKGKGKGVNPCAI